MNKSSISELVKYKREENKWSQQKLAEIAKLSIDTIRSIERGSNTNPTLYVIQQLQKALKIKFDI